MENTRNKRGTAAISTKPVVVRLGEIDIERMKKLAKEDGVTSSKFARKLINDEFERRDKKAEERNKIDKISLKLSELSLKISEFQKLIT